MFLRDKCCNPEKLRYNNGSKQALALPHKIMTTAIINEMREWLLECDMDCDDCDALSDSQVVRVVSREWDGGLVDFMLAHS